MNLTLMPSCTGVVQVPVAPVGLLLRFPSASALL